MEFLTETCASRARRALAAAARAQREWGPVFCALDEEKVMRQARSLDAAALRSRPAPLHGLTVSVKDLFDVEGEPTHSGSRSREHVPMALRDAAAVARLRAAGALLFGRTTMAELAYSGLGINSYQGTPHNPRYAGEARIPGGSSSGAAVSVATGVVDLALCSDTGGSARIPAALCGIVGFKPTQSAVSRAGMFPLSPTLDSVGLMAREMTTISHAFATLRTSGIFLKDPPLSSLSMCVIERPFLDDAEDAVSQSFEQCVRSLSGAGIQIERISVPELAWVDAINQKGGFQAAEAFAAHSSELKRADCRIEPRIAARIWRGATQTPDEMERRTELRQRLIGAFWACVSDYDAVIVPTVPIHAPPIADLHDEHRYTMLNQLLLRNPSVTNLLDGCSISLPYASHGAAMGIMLMAAGGRDDHLIAAARSISAHLTR